MKGEGPDVNFAAGILDEIALEGLDGITLQALWVRLAGRPFFAFKIDAKSKPFIWSCIGQMPPNVCFYELPSPRPELVLYNRFDHYDSESGQVVETEELVPSDIYQHVPIKDGGVQGSCGGYHVRKDVTDEARGMGLGDAEERWGSRLVIVADQEVRTMALIGNQCDPSLELTIVQYCMLERIGRARHLGEVTQGKQSLQVLGEDSKTLHYYRKVLIRQKLITKQAYNVRKSTQTNTSCGTLLHLTRFYVERRSKARIFLEQVVAYLSKKPPHYAAEYEEVRQALGMSTNIKKSIQGPEFQKYVSTDVRMPYRMLYQNATKDEWKQKGSNKERLIRVMKLIDPEVDVHEALAAKDDPEYDEDPADKGYLDQSNMVMNRQLLQHAYYLLEKVGPQGCSQAELGRLMGQSKLDSRLLCRNLVRKGMATTYTQDEGRQRVCRYVSRKYETQSKLTVELKMETDRLRELIGSCEADGSGQAAPNEIPETAQQPGLFETVTVDSCFDSTEVTLNADDSTADAGPSDAISNIVIDVQVMEIKLKDEADVKYGNMSFLQELSPSGKCSGPSTRLIRRANLIIQAVHENKVISDTAKLHKLISEEEVKEGYTAKIDRKTLLRLLHKLEVDGSIKHMKAILKSKDKEKTLFFVCHPTITPDHSLIQSVIEQAKIKFFVVGTELMRKMQAKFKAEEKAKDAEKENPFGTPTVGESVREIKDMDPVAKLIKTMVQSKAAGREYGYVPKFMRMREMHTFLYYLVYGFEGNPELDQYEAITTIEAAGFDLTEDVRQEMSRVYVPEVSWKMFVLPLPVHNGWPNGWCLMCDVLLRLPLSMFLKVVHVTYRIPKLNEYILHPVRRHYLVRNLPLEVRNCLLAERRYMYHVHEATTLLCYAGLVQFGPQKQKEKDQIFLFLNRKAALLDTTSSAPGYHQTSEKEYPKMDYNFNTIHDVETYWYDLWNMAMHTPLGCRNSSKGKKVTLEFMPKPEMEGSMRPRKPDEPYEHDTGEIPGDNRGAAGLDSAFFVHLKRNWSWQAPRQQSTEEKAKVAKTKEAKVVRWAKYKAANNQTVSVPVTMQPNVKRTTKGMRRKLVDVPEKVVMPRRRQTSQRVYHRVFKPRKTTQRKPYYDDTDRAALGMMSKLRVDWSSTEDTTLLVCKVASMYLVPQKHSRIANCSVVRDILHRNVPESKNKTSRACQRRLVYMMKNQTTLNNVSLFVEEVKQDLVVQERFGSKVDEIKESELGLDERVAEMNKVYVELVEYLREKFTFQKDTEDLELPDTVDEVYQKFTIVAPPKAMSKRRLFQEPKTTLDIQYGVITSLAYSSLCSLQDKTSRAYQLYKIYQQYPDALLRSVITRMRNDQMVSLKKAYLRSQFRQGSYLPLNSSPFQLSIRYLHLMQNRFQYGTFSTAFHMMQRLLTEGTCDVVVGSEGGWVAVVVEMMAANRVQFHVEVPGQIIVLDPKVADVDEPYVRILQRYKDILTNAQGGRGVPTTSAVFKEGADSPDADSEVAQARKRKADEASHEAKKAKLAMMQSSVQVMIKTQKPAEGIIFQEDISKGASTSGDDQSQNSLVARAASRIALYMMREEMRDTPSDTTQHAHDFFMVNSCEVSCTLVSDPNHSFILDSTKVQSIINRLSTTLSDRPSQSTFLQMSRDAGHTEQQTIALADLLGWIKSKREFGATGPEVVAFCSGLNTDMVSLECVQFLISSRVINRVGIVRFRYVAHPHLKPWVISSYKLLRLQRENLTVIPENSLYRVQVDDETTQQGNSAADQPVADVSVSNAAEEVPSTSSEVIHEEEDADVEQTAAHGMKRPREVVTVDRRFRSKKAKTVPKEMTRDLENADWKQSEQIDVPIRPWIRIDGTLNRRVLDRLLGSVLCYLMELPGTRLNSAAERFTPALQPFQTSELIEILMELGCVRAYKVVRKGNPSLFSKTPQIEVVPVDSIALEDDGVLFEATSDAIMRMGQFIGVKNYTTDFLAGKEIALERKGTDDAN